MDIVLARREFTATGGAELYLKRLIQALISKNHKVSLVTGDANAKIEGVNINYVKLSGARSDRVRQYDQGVQKIAQGLSYDCMMSLERLSRQDVLRAGDGVHATWLEQRKLFSPFWRRFFVGLGSFHKTMMEMEKKSYDPLRTRRLIVNSEMVGRDIHKKFGFPKDRIHLVRNGIEEDKFRGGEREKTRQRWGVRDDEFVLLFVGAGWERKGLKFVIDATNMLKGRGIKLVVAGGRKKPVFLNEEILYLGQLNCLKDVYAAADLLVFPPIYEPSANVVFEALAAGLPVVTSKFNGAAEVIEENVNGNVVDNPSNLPILTNAISEWCEHKPGYRVNASYDISLERNIRETVKVLELSCLDKSAPIQ